MDGKLNGHEMVEAKKEGRTTLVEGRYDLLLVVIKPQDFYWKIKLQPRYPHEHGRGQLLRWNRHQKQGSRQRWESRERIQGRVEQCWVGRP